MFLCLTPSTRRNTNIQRFALLLSYLNLSLHPHTETKRSWQKKSFFSQGTFGPVHYHLGTKMVASLRRKSSRNISNGDSQLAASNAFEPWTSFTQVVALTTRPPNHLILSCCTYPGDGRSLQGICKGQSNGFVSHFIWTCIFVPQLAFVPAFMCECWY